MVPAPQQLSAADEAAATALGHKLRCPVCQGMPIAESPATMAVDMMHRVRQMQAQGRSEDEILGYFTSRYGAWVLLDPPREGFALWVWVLPPLFMLVLAAGAVRMLRRLHERGARADGAQPHPAPEPPADSLLAAVRAEVDR
jgi:cytochrome c-type biogenesis protein CcmH